MISTHFHLADCIASFFRTFKIFTTVKTKAEVSIGYSHILGNDTANYTLIVLFELCNLKNISFNMLYE